MFAQTRLFFPTKLVIIDYSEHQVAGRLEDFIIAHELAHYRYNHIFLRIVFESILVGATVTLAIEFSVGRPFISAAAVALPTILTGIALLLPLSRFITYVTEGAADQFAAKVVGFGDACEQMARLKDALPESYRSEKENLDRRITRLRERANEWHSLT